MMLNGWKAIAAYLRRDERTAMRWAAERGLPVHRIPGPGRGSVYALAAEVDAWLGAERARTAAVPDAPAGRDAPAPEPEPEPEAEPASAEPAAPAAAEPATRAPRRWRPVGAALALVALLLSAGMLARYLLRAERPAPEAVFADRATEALFLQAQYDWNLRTPASLRRAVREFADTIGRDPRVPAAYVGLANSYLLLREYGSLPDAEAYARAGAATQAALALAPDSADAHRAQAFIAFWWRQDRAAARSEFQRALALRPGDPLTHHWLANALLANGEDAAALREIEWARELDPVDTTILADRAMILYFAGHRGDGWATLRALVREQPGTVRPHQIIAEIALFEGRPDAFLRETAIAARLRADAGLLAEAERWRAAGPGAAGIEAAMLHDARAAHAGWFAVAKLAALAGRREEAADALARACAAREPTAVSAPDNLWLSRSLSREDIAARCGRPLPLS